MAYQGSSSTVKLYRSVIEEVVSGVRDSFLDEGIDEQVLQELKQLWETKVLATKAVDTLSDTVPAASAASSSGTQSRSRNYASNAAHSSSSTGSSTAAAANITRANTTNVIQTAPPAPPTVVVARPTVANLDAAVAAGFHHLAGQHVFQSAAASARAAHQNFAAFQPGVITSANAGQGLIIPGNVPVRFINAAQLPTIPAQLMQLNQNIAAAHARNEDTSRNGTLPQVDGPTGLSDDEDEFDDDDDAQETNDEPAEATGVEMGEPLNSEDDVSNEDAEEMFDADNVVVCQYEKVTRTRNKWKFVLKDGIMNLDGKDYVFNRANGEAEF